MLFHLFQNFQLFRRIHCIARFFLPGGPDRSKKVISRVLQISEYDATQMLNQTLRDFSDRHRNISRIFTKNFNRVYPLIKDLGVEPESLTNARTLLIGSYFTMEYSIESAAFFNPSMVEDPDQTNLQAGQKRIIVSFRATGEGHISSIVFRESKAKKVLGWQPKNGLKEIVFSAWEFEKKYKI